MTDTIFAPATAAGRAAVAVVRISGPATAQAVRALAGRLPAARPGERLAPLAYETTYEIDRGLVLWMPAPGSYTGEDSAEFHVHGGPAVVACPGERHCRRWACAWPSRGNSPAAPSSTASWTSPRPRASPTWWTPRRKPSAGRPSPSWAAGFPRCRLAGGDGLVRASAMLEAAVDFPDEEVPADVANRARPILEILADELEAAAADVTRGEQVREGFRIALLGAPNAGEPLLNALARRGPSILRRLPARHGDIIEVPLVLGGYKAIVADTAGLSQKLRTRSRPKACAAPRPGRRRRA